MNKRCQETEVYFLMFEFLFIIMVGFALFNHVDSIKDDILFEKTYLARDLGLLINTVYAAPGNLFYRYSTTGAGIIHKLNFEFNDGTIYVKERSKGFVIPGFFVFGIDNFMAPNTKTSLRGDVLKNEFIYLSNYNDNIALALPDLNVLYKQQVPEVDTKKENVNINIKEGLIGFSDFLDQKFTISDKEAILSLSVKKGDHNFIKVYCKNNVKNRKLSALIINSILKSLKEVKGTSIVPSNKNEMVEYDIILEYGEEFNQQKITQGIANGIKENFK